MIREDTHEHLTQRTSPGDGRGSVGAEGPTRVAAQTGRHLHDVFQVLPRPAHRRSVSRGLRLERNPPSPGNGPRLDLHRSDPGRRCEQDAAERVSVDEALSVDRGGIDAWWEHARRRWSAAHRRARSLSAERKRSDDVPAVRILSADRQGLQGQRAIGARVQRQAPLVEVGMGEGDVRHVEAYGVPADGGLQPARDVEDALDRDAVGSSDSGSRLRLLRRRRQLRLPRPRDAPGNGRAASRRRDRRRVGAGLSW